MAGNKYLSQSGGNIVEVVASQTSAGVGDAGKLVALTAAGLIDSTMMPVGIGADTAVIIASETLVAGNYVNVWNNASVFSVRKADNTVAGKEAHGFVLAGVTSGANATVYFEGSNNQVTGQTAGVVYLGTAGAGLSTAPSGTDVTVQRLGMATSATVVNFQSSPPITLA
jgi:hypothetical protein